MYVITSHPRRNSYKIIPSDNPIVMYTIPRCALNQKHDGSVRTLAQRYVNVRGKALMQFVSRVNGIYTGSICAYARCLISVGLRRFYTWIPLRSINIGIWATSSISGCVVKLCQFRGLEVEHPFIFATP
jgi:hypothetical protein